MWRRDYMNPDDYIYKKRDWLNDLIKDGIECGTHYNDHIKKNYKDLYEIDEKAKYMYDPWMDDRSRDGGYVETRPSRFGAGDLLNAGGIVALVVSVIDGLNGWKYSVMRDGELMHVDEVALNEWSAI
jgi:hypothetical protein